MLNISMFSLMFTNWMLLSNHEVNTATKDCIGAYHRQFMSDFEIWLEANEDELSICCSENGCDYEPDFDFEQYLEDQYYLSIEEPI